MKGWGMGAGFSGVKGLPILVQDGEKGLERPSGGKLKNKKGRGGQKKMEVLCC